MRYLNISWVIKTKMDKARRKEYDRRYNERNREKIRERHREYYKSENGKKIRRTHEWKLQGIIADSWEEVYSWYMETETCDICDRVLTTGTLNTSSMKCLDHDHSIKDDYNIRGVICHSCNASERSTHKYVYPNGPGYRFQKSIKGKSFCKCFKTLEEAVAFRDAFIYKDYSV